MPGKGALARKKAIKKDVDAWVNYAFYSGDHNNPFEAQDKRRDMFAEQLQRTLFIDQDFREMHEIHGGDKSQLSLRPYAKPSLVPISELALAL